MTCISWATTTISERERSAARSHTLLFALSPFASLIRLSESEWPVGPNGAVAKKSFDSPQAPVHVVTGAGGAPAFGATEPTAAGGAAPPDFTRLNVYRWSFSAVTVFNASHLLYEQIDNNNSTAIDSFVVVQPKHGKFGGGGGGAASA